MKLFKPSLTLERPVRNAIRLTLFRDTGVTLLSKMPNEVLPSRTRAPVFVLLRKLEHHQWVSSDPRTGEKERLSGVVRVEALRLVFSEGKPLTRKVTRRTGPRIPYGKNAYKYLAYQKRVAKKWAKRYAGETEPVSSRKELLIGEATYRRIMSSVPNNNDVYAIYIPPIAKTYPVFVFARSFHTQKYHENVYHEAAYQNVPSSHTAYRQRHRAGLRPQLHRGRR